MASKNIQSKIATSLSQLNQPHSIKFFENLLFLNDPAFPSASNSRLAQGASILASFFRSFADSAHSLSLDKTEGRFLLKILESFNWDHYGAFDLAVNAYADVLMHASALFPEKIPLFFDFLVKWLSFEAENEKVHLEIINVLCGICSLVPLSVVELNKVTARRFPFGMAGGKGALVIFVRNLFRLSLVVPSLRLLIV